MLGSALKCPSANTSGLLYYHRPSLLRPQLVSDWLWRGKMAVLYLQHSIPPLLCAPAAIIFVCYVQRSSSNGNIASEYIPHHPLQSYDPTATTSCCLLPTRDASRRHLSVALILQNTITTTTTRFQWWAFKSLNVPPCSILNFSSASASTDDILINIEWLMSQS